MMDWNLVADVGGTNMRLAALSPEGEILRQITHESSGPLTVAAACKAFIEDVGPPPAWLVVAAAGPVRGGQVELTNVKQTLSEVELAALCPEAQVRILNDFEAAAWSLATVGEAQVESLQGRIDNWTAPRVIVGPGTGLGVGALVWAGGRPQVVAGEGGHVSLAPRCRAEVDYFECLVAAHPEFAIGDSLAVEAEAILSGTGVPLFYRAIGKATGEDAPLRTAGEIFGAARGGAAPLAEQTVSLFRDYLGTLSGDLGLAFGAWGGVFITGGVAQANRFIFDEAFLVAFRAGGRHSDWRAALPLCLYQDANFGLLGARNFIAAQDAP
jgi:glucokinase